MILLSSACGNKTKTEFREEAAISESKGYAFCYNRITIEIDAEAAPILKELGEAESCFEAISCVFEGIDRMYNYRSFEIDTYPVNDVDYISAVIFKDDSIATTEGVAIGDSVDKVIETYGTGDDVGGMLVYEKDDVKLCFIIKDGAVASVEYRTTVLGR